MAKGKRKKANEKLSRALAKHWTEFIADASAQDISALVQKMLRESYVETMEDLQFYADKVRYFNKLKKAIRKEITKSRQALMCHVISEGCRSPDDPVETYVPLCFESYPILDEDCNPQVVTNEGDPFNTRGEMEDYIEGLERLLATVGDDAQLANIDLQNMLQKQQQTLQFMSNVSKMLHDTAMAIIRKIG